MMPKKALNSLIVVFLTVALLLVSCQPTPIIPQPTNRPITLGTTLKPLTFDPADSYDLASLMIIYNLGDTLYTYELGSTKLKAQLAQALPKISSDGLTYTINLRQGIVFHDGTPFNAQAMVFSLERFIKNGGKPSFLLSDSLDKIEAIGEYELRLRLKHSFTAFTALLAFPGTCAVSPAAYELGEGKFKPNDFVGTGPYRLVEMTGDRIRLQAFAQYWGEKPKNSGLDIQLYPGNPANLYNALRTGAVDVAYQSLATQQVSKLQEEAKRGKGQVVEGKGSAVNYLSLNLRMQPLKALKVRQAIAAMVDRPFLVQRILQGQAEPLYTLIPTAFTASQPVFKPQNLLLAKQLLTEAGFSSTQPATVEIWYSSGSLNASLLAGILKAMAKRDLAGMLNFEPNTIASAAFFRNLSAGNYASSLANWYPDFLDADNYIYPFLACSKGSPLTGCQKGGAQEQGSFYYSERMNQLIVQQRLEQDPTKREEIFSQIQSLLAQDVPYIPLWQSKDYAFAQNNLKGITINPSQTFPFWTLERG